MSTLPPKSKRNQGRPALKSNGVGAEKIVNAAISLLKNKKPSQITQSLVAKKAGVDPKLVRYYFGDLNTLMEATLSTLVEELSLVMTEATQQGESATEKMVSRIAALTGFFLKNPNAWQIIVSNIYGTKSKFAVKTRATLNINGYDRLNQVISLGRKNGEFHDDFDGRFLYVALIGLSEIFVTARPLFEVLKPKFNSKTLEEDYVNFITSLVLRSISK
jgi:AcrR family transcriptional regulator